MKSMLGGFAAAALLAVLAWGYLDGEVQRSAEVAHTTSGARP